MPTHPLGTLIADPVVNGSSTTTTGTHFAKLGIGAARQVQSLVDRDTIPVGTSLNSDNDTSGMREVSMLVYVADTDVEYRLKVPNWEVLNDTEKLQALADNNNWVPVMSNASNITFNFNRGLRHQHIIYVGGDRFGNDSTAELDNIERPYLSLRNASLRAREIFDNSGAKSLVVTLPGNYEAETFVENHVDYYFEEGTILFSDTANTPVISDATEILDDVEISGQGIFTHLRTGEEEGNYGIFLSRIESKLKIACKTIDGFNLAAMGKQEFELSDCTVLYPQLVYNENKIITFKNVTFENGAALSLNSGNLTEVLFNACTMEVPAFRFSDARNTSLDLIDYRGNLFNRVQIFGNDFDLDFSSAAVNLNVTINQTFNRTSNNTVVPTGVAGFTYAQTLNGNFLGNVKTKLINCQINIRRRNGIGVMFMKFVDNPFGSGLGHIVIQNLRVDDEVRIDSVAFASSWAGQASTQEELSINGFIHNCVNATTPMPRNNPTNEWVTLGWQELT